MDILEKIDNILVEVKDAGEKHDLLLKVWQHPHVCNRAHSTASFGLSAPWYQVFHTGGFKHVYGYTEKYLTPLGQVPSLNRTMTDLTHIFAGHSRVNHQQTSDMEDHWYTREPLPTSFLTT